MDWDDKSGIQAAMSQVVIGHGERRRAGVGFAVFVAVSAAGESGAEFQGIEGGPEGALVPVEQGRGCLGRPGVVDRAVRDHKTGELLDCDGCRYQQDGSR